jgi:2,5-diketo-D-gluconate reductase A
MRFVASPGEEIARPCDFGRRRDRHYPRMIGGRSRVLADGTVMPLLGLGVWQVPDGPECVRAVRAALELGYGHIDTRKRTGTSAASDWHCARAASRATKSSSRRSFTPRCATRSGRPRHSTAALGVDYVDLYLVHWPATGATWAWPGMEAARGRSCARAIGVSNFDSGELDQLIAGAQVTPAINQVQFNPSTHRKALLDACTERGVGLGPTARSEPARSCATR